MLQPLSIAEWKRDVITMDFVKGLPISQCGHDVIWMIVDRLMKITHFLPIKITNLVDTLSHLYIHECLIEILGSLIDSSRVCKPHWRLNCYLV